MAYFCTILVEGVRTIREGVLIEEGALTKVVRYTFLASIFRIIVNLFFPHSQGIS